MNHSPLVITVYIKDGKAQFNMNWFLSYGTTYGGPESYNENQRVISDGDNNVLAFNGNNASDGATYTHDGKTVGLNCQSGETLYASYPGMYYGYDEIDEAWWWADRD